MVSINFKQLDNEGRDSHHKIKSEMKETLNIKIHIAYIYIYIYICTYSIHTYIRRINWITLAT